MFPDEYKNAIFIAEHGSWDRVPKIGYRVAVVKLDSSMEVTSHEIFAEGWLVNNTQHVWGRPVSMDWLPDGSMLLSDDKANVIYRISYSASEEDAYPY